MEEEYDEFTVPDSEDRKIPRVLLWFYVVLVLWGIWAFYAYWDGSSGWPNRGYWRPLQEAAHTTEPWAKAMRQPT